MNTGCTPQGIFLIDPLNQIASLEINLRTTADIARLPTPDHPKTSPLAAAFVDHFGAKCQLAGARLGSPRRLRHGT